MLLREEDRKALQEEFAKLEKPVKIIFFNQKVNCQYCEDTHQILKEITELSDKLILEEVSLITDGEMGKKYGVDKAPAIVITDEEGTPSGVIFSGIPAGYEFISLIGAIMDRGTGNLELSQATQEEVKKIDKDVHLMVFVTPTCPYCPRAVRIAHQMAYLNPHITGEMIEATEFPELSQRFNVMAVPRTVINEDHYFEGAYPEAMVLQELKKALGEAGAESSLFS